MRIKFLDQAKVDLAEIEKHYRDVGGNPLARTMVNRIKQPVLALRDNPLLAPAYELAPDIRRLVAADGTFLVFYRIREDIEVLHVRRAERRPAGAEDLAS